MRSLTSFCAYVHVYCRVVRVYEGREGLEHNSITEFKLVKSWLVSIFITHVNRCNRQFLIHIDQDTLENLGQNLCIIFGHLMLRLSPGIIVYTDIALCF